MKLFSILISIPAIVYAFSFLNDDSKLFGAWKETPMKNLSYIYQITKSGSKFRLEVDARAYGQNHSFSFPLSRKIINDEEVYIKKGAFDHHQYVIKDNGNLEIRDSEGRITIAKELKNRL